MMIWNILANPINEKPTPKTRAPSSPNNFLYMVGTSVKWPPSQKKAMQIQIAYAVLFVLAKGIARERPACIKIITLYTSLNEK